ncbi:MAG: photosystem I assembly protein Ycf3 [Methanosaeta sp. PtaB.Bin087]|nr:MAG: photosystem I assembly protein Ycf3 [Methanosaeta sp. PtaB.Bin087]
MMLSMAATALAQVEGDEDGTDKETAPMAEAEIPSPEERNLLGNIDLVVKILGGIAAFLVSLIAIYKFFWKKEEKAQSDGNGHRVETAKDSPISFGDQSPTIKADRIEGGLHITYPGTKETPKQEKPPDKINNIPHPHNPNFTGRVDLLEKLEETLASGERAAFTQTSAITGLGGVGKTQLALEYSYSHADDYRVIWWVRSEEPATLAADYAGLAARLNLSEKSSQDQRVTVEAVRRWLEENGGWLLVFDNAQEPENLTDYLPRTGAGHVIITSRNPNWGGTAKPLLVDVFSRQESVEFLLSRTGQTDGAHALAETLGDLPLALEQAGAYIQETGISLSAYLKLFQKRQKELLRRGKPDAYPDTVATTWDLSFQKAREEVPASADLLNLCAFLAPDDIPKSLLTGGIEHLPEPLASAVTDEMALNDAVAALKRYSLMTVADDTLSVHRLVQAVARDRLSEEERKRWAETAVRLVNGAFPYDSVNVRTWDECSVLYPHALVAAKYAEEVGTAPRATSCLLNQIGLYLKGRAQFDEARAAYERALKIDKEVFGLNSNHPNVAKTLGNIGNVLRQKGDLDGAELAYGKVLLIFKEVYGLDSSHPDVALTHMNLGNVLYQKGDLDGANLAYEKALSIYDKVYALDSNHPEIARTFMNLGNVLAQKGDLNGAKLAYEKALSIYDKVYALDSNHPEIARTFMNLGNVQYEKGDLDGAKLAYEKALSIYDKVYALDSNHPEIARTFMNLGNVLYKKGNIDGAEKSYKRALEIFRSRLGEDHPTTKLVRENLESLLR